MTNATSIPSVENAEVPNPLDPLKNLEETSLFKTVIYRPGKPGYILHKELSDISMQFLAKPEVKPRKSSKGASTTEAKSKVFAIGSTSETKSTSENKVFILPKELKQGSPVGPRPSQC